MYPPSEPTLVLDPAMLMDSTLPDEEGSEYEYEYDENETEVRLNLQGLIAIFHSAYLSLSLALIRVQLTRSRT